MKPTYYGLIRNRLGEWCVYTRGNSRQAVRDELMPLEKGGLRLEDIRIIKAGLKEGFILPFRFKFTYTDNTTKVVEISAENRLRVDIDFLSYVHMALTDKLKNIVSIALVEYNDKVRYIWRNEEAAENEKARRRNVEEKILRNDPKAWELLKALAELS